MKNSMYVLYDGDCGLCRRTIDRVMALDWLHRLTPLNGRDRAAIEKQGFGRLDAETLAKDLHAAKGEKIWKGYDAYRTIASHIPLLWPVWPLLWVWPVTWIGRRIYRKVADTRSLSPADWPEKSPHCEKPH